MDFASVVMTFAIACGIAGVVYALFIAVWVNKQDAGNEKMKQISDAVKEGAYAFLAREYKTVAMVAVVLFIVLAAVPKLGIWSAVGFLIGTVGSALAGFVGTRRSATYITAPGPGELAGSAHHATSTSKPAIAMRFTSNGVARIISGSVMRGSFMTFALTRSRWARDR